MSQLINKASEALFNITEKKYSFNAAIKLIAKETNLDSTDSASLFVLVISSLRHYLLLSYFIKQNFEVIDQKDFCLFLVSLSEKIYVHKIDENDVLENLKNNLISDKKDDFCAIFSAIHEKNDLFCGNEKTLQFVDYFSLRFNIPNWVIKLWRNHFNNKECIEMCKNLYANKKFVSFNNYRNHNKEFDKEAFKETSVDGLLEYNLKTPLRNHNDLIQHKLLLSNPCIKEVLNYSDILNFGNVAIYTNFNNALHEEILNYVGKEGNIDLICSLPQIKNNFEWFTKALKLENFHIYECPISSVLTCLSNKVHNFIVAPKGTYLDNLRIEPDYFLKSTNVGLDDVIKEEQVLINDAYQFIEDGGYLTYIIPTANNKEGTLLIKDFLNEHKDAVLIKERQFVPNEEFDVCYYYAVLKKEIKNEN